MTSAPTPQSAPPAEQLAAVTGLILDCDGVLTPGDLYYDENGRRLLRFFTRDGVALALLCKSGIAVGVVSGRPSDIAERRLRELGVSAFMGRCRNKTEGVRAMCRAFDIDPAHCAFMGDDVPDLAAFAAVGLRIAVADAALELKAAAHWVTQMPGGRGAVREVGEAILKARGDWQRYIAAQLAPKAP